MKKFPYIEVAGSHRDIGHAIGETFQKQIKFYIQKRKTQIPHYQTFLEKTYPYFTLTLQTFPQYMEELTAIAQAASVGVADYFFCNTREIYDIEEEKQNNKNDHCTIAIANTPAGSIVGHNEDWISSSIDQLYVLKAKVNGITFLGLNYAMSLPGVSASINSYGLVQCINDLCEESTIGVPKNFLARAILECRSLNEAESLIKQTQRASGFNHVLVQGNEIRNIEISGNDLDVQRMKHVTYVHTNHFMSHHMQQYETEKSPSSIFRYERAHELIRTVASVEQMKSLLRDTTNTQYPICRSDATIGSVIIEPSKRIVHVCYGPPCKGEYTKYTL